MIKLSDIKDEELKSTLELAHPSVIKNSSLLTVKDLKQDIIYHIAKNDFRQLVPNISRRGASSEDNTLPRICVADCLFNCIIGHSGVILESISDAYDKDNDKSPTGAYFIYSIPFEYILKPNTKLVYDADYTNELWLFSYKKDNKTFKPCKRDIFIVTEIVINPGHKDNFLSTATIIVSVKKDKLKLNNDRWLDPGYWKIKFSSTIGNHYTIISIEKSNEKEFQYNKSVRTTLEHRSDSLSFKDW